MTQRTPRHTTHLRNLPKKVTIIRPLHPFEGQSLSVLRHSHRQGRLYFVLILPDGSKSLIPAAWTDFDSTARPSGDHQLVGSLEDLLHLRSLVDALLGRTVVSAIPIADQESHAATASEDRKSVVWERVEIEEWGES